MCEKCSMGQLHPKPPSRRSVVLFAASALGLMLADTANAKEKTPPKPQNVLSPDAALKKLMEGNARYVDGTSKRHDFKHEREALVGGQNPYAAVLSCADSRIAPEYAFDSARGDLFVCRVAGNFANDDTVASMEYTVAVLGTPLILVLGHDSCGASRCDDQILEGQQAAAGTHSVSGGCAGARGEGVGTAERKSARQRHPPERDR